MNHHHADLVLEACLLARALYLVVGLNFRKGSHWHEWETMRCIIDDATKDATGTFPCTLLVLLWITIRREPPSGLVVFFMHATTRCPLPNRADTDPGYLQHIPRVPRCPDVTKSHGEGPNPCIRTWTSRSLLCLHGFVRKLPPRRLPTLDEINSEIRCL